jgi:hypothetical protein
MTTELVSASGLPKNLSFQFNPREPSTSSRAYKAMREQLEKDPAAFAQLNTGIVIANDRFVLDGGHTILAIQDSIKEGKVKPEQVQLRVTYMGGLSEGEMAARAIALNTKVTPPLRGEKAIQGHWLALERNLDDKYRSLYEFKPNTNLNSRFHVDFLVALLHGWQEHSPERCYASKGVLVRLFTPEKYSALLPVLNLAVAWWSFIYRELLKEKRVQEWEGVNAERAAVLPDGSESSGFLSEAYVWPVYAAFHTVISQTRGEPVKAVRAALDAAWSERKGRMLNKLSASYRDAGSNPTKLGKDSKAYLQQVVALLG